VSEPIRLSAGDLHIALFREADRYRHEVVLRAGENYLPLLASIEGAADDDWPPSPPLQELHIEQRGAEKQVALLVGRAGRSHWSLSVEADVARQTLLFDIACRTPATADRLRSSYGRGAGGLPLSLSTVDRVALSSSIVLQILVGIVRSDVADERIVQVAPRQDRAPYGQIETFRWRYRINNIVRR
jgi:hypothetical protein